MVFVVGIKTELPSDRVKLLLGGNSFLTQTRSTALHGYNRFVTRDLECLRDSGGSIKPFLSDESIEWEDQGEIIIGNIE